MDKVNDTHIQIDDFDYYDCNDADIFANIIIVMGIYNTATK